MLSVYTYSRGETLLLAKELGQRLKGGEILALWGPLGSGKTTFVKGLARGLGIRKKVRSPSFLIYLTYRSRKNKKVLYHFDFYRLKHNSELEELGLGEILADLKNIAAIEWPNKIKNLLPRQRTIHLKFLRETKDRRRIQIWSNK